MVLAILGATIALVALTWWMHVRRAKRVRLQAGWPAADAVVQSSAVREAEERDSEGAREMAYYPEVAFSYAAAGQNHTGTGIQPGEPPRFTRVALAQALCARYPAGGTAKVRYNPAAPSEAYLQIPKADLGVPIVLTIALLVVGFFAIGVFAGA